MSVDRHCHWEEGMMTATYAMTPILISVVDDDASVRKTTKLLIESFGYRAVVFESAETFLKSGQLNDTSCLVVDVQMQGMNGLRLQSHLASEGCSIPIIFISAYRNNVYTRFRPFPAGNGRSEYFRPLVLRSRAFARRLEGQRPGCGPHGSRRR